MKRAMIAGLPTRLHARLFKTDHPRAIDRHIDYFGDTGRPAPAGDPCGEALLDNLYAAFDARCAAVNQ